MADTADTQLTADAPALESADAISTRSSDAAAPTETISAQGIEIRLRSAITDQLTQMDLARAAVAQAAAHLLRPATIASRNQQLLRPGGGGKEITAELRQALRELRRII
jgi:hypothetical protein